MASERRTWRTQPVLTWASRCFKSNQNQNLFAQKTSNRDI